MATDNGDRSSTLPSDMSGTDERGGGGRGGGFDGEDGVDSSVVTPLQQERVKKRRNLGWGTAGEGGSGRVRKGEGAAREEEGVGDGMRLFMPCYGSGGNGVGDGGAK